MRRRVPGWRPSRTTPSRTATAPAAASAGCSPAAPTPSRRRVVAEALKRLPPDFRMPVVLRDIEEWSYEEIAISLSLPVGTVKSRIARGRGQLKDILTPLLSGRFR